MEDVRSVVWMASKPVWMGYGCVQIYNTIMGSEISKGKEEDEEGRCSFCVCILFSFICVTVKLNVNQYNKSESTSAIIVKGV